MGHELSRRTLLHRASLGGVAAIGGATALGFAQRAGAQTAASGELVCTADEVRIRETYGTSTPVRGYVNTGDVVTQVGEPIEAEGFVWIPVRAKQNTSLSGWTTAMFFDEAVSSSPWGTRHAELRHNGSGWQARLSHYIDIRDFDADPTGKNNAAPAINQALVEAAKFSGGGPLPVVLGSGTRRATYSITEPIVLPEGAQLFGESLRGWRSEIKYVGTSLTDNAIQSWPSGPRSGVVLKNLRVVDGRTDPRRTGTGIHLNRVRDHIHLADLMVIGFYDNYFIGSVEAGSVGDRGRMDRCWAAYPLRYGVNIWRLRNHFSIIDFMCDTLDTGIAAINIQGNGPQNIVTCMSVSHENSGTTHTIQTDGSGLFAANVTMTNGNKGAGDVVRITRGQGTETTLVNITGDNAGFGSSATTMNNLVNLPEVGYSIPASERRVNFWTGWASRTSPYPAAIRVGRSKIVHVEVSPEALVPAEPGSLALGNHGAMYLKRIGRGNTGWTRLDPLNGSKTWDPPSVAAGSQTNTTVTVWGARLGHFAEAAFTAPVPGGCVLHAHVTNNDTVTVTLVNHTGSAVDLGSGTINVRVVER